MILQYDITVVGQNQLRNVLRGVESEIIASNKRMNTAIRGSAGTGRTKASSAAGASAEAKAATREAISEDKKFWRARQQEADKYQRDQIRNIEAAGRAQQAVLKKEQAARDKLITTVGRGVGRSVGNVVNKAATGATVAGGLLIGQALYSGMRAESGAARVANQGMHPELAPAIAKGSYNIQAQTSEASINALDQFVQKTGDLEAGMGAWKMLGELASATSTDFADMGQAAGTAYNFISDNVKDPIERMKQLKDVMTVLATQGNMSTVEMRDLAPTLGKISAAARRFGGDPIVMVKKLAAMGQLAVKRGGATDAAEETTSIGRFVDDLIKDSTSKKAKRNGFVDPFTDKSHTKLKDPVEIVTSIMEKSQGDLGKIGAMFGVRGQRAMSGVGNVWQKAHDDAEKVKKGTGNAAGAAAIAGGVGELVGAHKDIGEAANTVYKTAAAQYTDAMNKFDEAIGEKLVPAVTGLIPQFVKLVPAAGYLAEKLVQFVDWLQANPYTGIGTLIAGKVTADIAMAGIGPAVQGVIVAMLKSSSVGAVAGVPGAAGGAGGGVGAGGALGVLGGVGAIAGSSVLLGGQIDSLNKSVGGKHHSALGLGMFQDQDGKFSAKETLMNLIPGIGAGKTLLALGEGLTGAARQATAAPSRANTPEEYDRQQAAANAIATQKSAADLSSAAAKLTDAATKLAMNDPARTKPIVARSP